MSRGDFAMPKIELVGRIHPSSVNLTCDQLPGINWKAPELDLEMNFTFQIQVSVIRVFCDLNKWDATKHLVHVYMRALDLTRAIVDLASFDHGIGMTVLLETLVHNGKHDTIMFHQPNLSPISTAIKNVMKPATASENNFDKVLRHVFSDVSIFRALHDLVEAVAETHVAPLACGRAMEGIRHAIAPGLERKKGWTKMNHALRLERSYLDMILDTSTGPRHADPAHITGAVCIEITTRAWTIMNRFFEYLKRGSQPLAESEFPVLR